MPINPRCFHCYDLGCVLEGGVLRLCWRERAGADHNPPNDAASILVGAVEDLMIRKIVIDPLTFEIAKMLTQHTTDRPFDKEESLETHLTLPLRQFHNLIADLRKVWLLPVGSRKFKPHGYWIITDPADFAEWVEREKAAPITQLTWIHAVARRNFPLFAKQLELDFWQDMHGSDSVRQAA